MINRLGQRLKENFQETTRDLSLLAGSGGSGSAGYFDASEDKVLEVSTLLESRADSERLEGMKRIIAAMSKGRNMEGFFAQVVKNVVSGSIEIRKLVYIYLLRYAATNSDLLLLSINTFQKDLSDSSPLIRSMSLRVLTSIRLPIIQGIVMLGLKKLVNDRNPWVRKTVAGGLAKVYEMDSTTLPELIPLLQTLIASPSPLTLGATLTAFSEICPDRLDLLHPYYRHICRLMGDADEWGQVVVLDVLTRYARAMLEKPDGAGSAAPAPKDQNGAQEEDDFEGLDVDLAMLLDHAKPLLQSRNAAVVVGTATMYYNLAPAGHTAVGQELLVAPILRLAGTAGSDPTGSDEVTSLTWEVIAAMAEERPWLFTSRHSSFFLHAADSSVIKHAKLRSLIALVSADNAAASIREFKHYVNLPDEKVAEEAVRAIGHCVRTKPAVAESGLRALMRLLKSPRSSLVAQAVIVLKDVILKGVSLSSPQRLVARLAKQLDNITNASARASVFWLVGQFAADDSPDTTMGLKWDGVAPWVPDVLRKGIKGFVNEEAAAKLQVLTLASQLLVLSPSVAKLGALSQYLFTLARYDSDYDVRDRARFLAALLRGVREEKIGDEQADDEDVGGVTLRREQVKVVLLGHRTVTSDAVALEQAEFGVGSMSRITHKRLGAYVALPEWTDDPTDSTLRDSQEEEQVKHAPSPSPATYAAAPPQTAVPRNISSSTPRIASPMGSSPAGSVPQARAKFRDLDDFLNSEEESEEEEEEEESDDESFVHQPVSAPPRRDIVPEYDEDDDQEDEDSEEEEDEDSEEEEDSDEYDEYVERAPLYRQ